MEPKIVKYSRPAPGEEGFRFILREDNGDRVLIELICDMHIRPVECVAKSEICDA